MFVVCVCVNTAIKSYFVQLKSTNKNIVALTSTEVQVVQILVAEWEQQEKGSILFLDKEGVFEIIRWDSNSLILA